MSNESKLIDYRELVSRYSFAEHAERANRYFASLDTDAVITKKPFADPEEAAELCAGIGALLRGLRIFPGARVLDFGAGTCWLSRIFAMLGCEVTATDVSAQALELGRRVNDGDLIASRLSIDYVPLSESKLPFADGTFDRVICFDALHHVPDQLGAIAEFARVLKDGGIAALHEPGPEHSRHPQSQYEMRNHGVIEGDIRVEALFSKARAHGFSGAKLAVFSVAPVFSDLDGFNDFLADSSLSSPVACALGQTVRDSFLARRVFFLEKGDSSAHMDSRSRAGLHAAFNFKVEHLTGAVRVFGQVRNTGPVTWLPSGYGLGEVNLGVHLNGPDGRVIQFDYARRPVSSHIVRPGEAVMMDVSVPYPGIAGECSLVFDLVAEGVSWFELNGGDTVTVDISKQPRGCPASGE